MTAGDRMAVVFDVVTELCDKRRRPVFRDVAHGACMLDDRLAGEVTSGQVRASIDYLVTAGMLRTSLVMDRWWLWPSIATDVLLDVRAVA